MSPLLFNFLIADMEEEIRKVKWERAKLGENKIYTLGYADMVLLAENEKEMRSMIERLQGYLERD